jgi:hypothetical protein
MCDISSDLVVADRSVEGGGVNSNKVYVYVILFTILILGFLLRWPLVTYNLPVASRVDERTSLRILHRFENGSYIGTDILLTVLSLSALLFFTLFFRNTDYKYWFAGTLMTGLAISTKYTAVLVVATYLILEFLFFKNSAGSNNNWLERRFSVHWLSAGVLIAGILCLAFYVLFPLQFVLSWIEQQGSIDFTLDPQELLFIEGFRSKFLILGILFGIVFLLSLRFKALFSRFCYLRPYLGLILMLLVFVLDSPFCLISWQDFMFDFGCVLKQNALTSGKRQYLRLVGLYLGNESIIVLILFLIGVYWLVRCKKSLAVPVTYLVVYYVYHGESSRSVTRYWTPILPVVFIISAYGICSTANLCRRLKWGYVAFTLIACMSVGLEISSKYASTHYISKALETDNMYGSYHHILDNEPRRIYDVDYIPDVELRVEGFDLQRIPERWIMTDDPALLQKIGADDVLMVDERLEAQMSPALRQDLSLEWSSHKKGHGHGRYFYRR